MDPKTKTGAVVSKEHRDKIIDYINLAIEEGGNVLCGGNITTPLNQPSLEGGTM